MSIEQQVIRVVDRQSRFESWASEDKPRVIDPATITLTSLKDWGGYIPSMASLYQNIFNSQNQRLYSGVSDAKLIWDEEPWTQESARDQLLEELSANGATCFVAVAGISSFDLEPIGFIIARKVDFDALTAICGSREITSDILSACGQPSVLLWEDAACRNLITPEDKTIRGVGSKLYRQMAQEADRLEIVSIGRTSPGSFAEKILPKVGFYTPKTTIQDGKDKQRYWLIRKNEK